MKEMNNYFKILNNNYVKWNQRNHKSTKINNILIKQTSLIMIIFNQDLWSCHILKKEIWEILNKDPVYTWIDMTFLSILSWLQATININFFKTKFIPGSPWLSGLFQVGFLHIQLFKSTIIPPDLTCKLRLIPIFSKNIMEKVKKDEEEDMIFEKKIKQHYR